MPEKQILIICGEASGDLNAAGLVSAVRKIDPGIKFSGVGGTLLRNAGADIFYDIGGLAVIGLFDALKKLPKFFTLKKLILEKIKTNKPDAVIFVDFSGFNLRLAREINNAIPTIYYISPQVWASRIGRVKTIKKYIRKMIVLFKFEEEFYKGHGINAEFAGCPLLDIVRPTMAKEELLNNLKFTGTKTTIALLPGSRKQEIKNILPIMLKACILINKKRDAQFVIAKSIQVEWPLYNQIIGKFNLGVKIIEGRTYDCLNIADFSLVASGTATLEAAIMQKPFCVIYKMNLLNYFLYRPQIKLPFIGMVNIVAGRLVVAEFIQFGAKAKRIARQVLKTLSDPAELAQIKNNLAQVKSALGEPGASSRAARIVVDLLNNP